MTNEQNLLLGFHLSFLSSKVSVQALQIELKYIWWINLVQRKYVKWGRAEKRWCTSPRYLFFFQYYQNYEVTLQTCRVFIKL